MNTQKEISAKIKIIEAHEPVLRELHDNGSGPRFYTTCPVCNGTVGEDCYCEVGEIEENYGI